MSWNPLSWFPWTRAGRQTLIYLSFALSGPAITALVIAAMLWALEYRQFDTFGTLALIVGGALLISVSGLAVFVSLRAIKLGRDGFEVSGSPNEGESP